MLDKIYQPALIEGLTYRIWEEARAFAAGRPDRIGARPFAIVIPPPNVTGSLHMGHALNNTLQDVLVRFERMRGRDVLWQPGTDHAGIATQMVVERQLLERHEPDRRALGREEFVRRVWQWKVESGGAIINQLKRLGASCDWSRERFTMDEGLSRAVRKVFVDLYRAGLIYKDKRLVNWDPKLLTAISDLEVEQVEHRGTFKWSRESGEPFDSLAFGKVLDRDPYGHLYYLRYPLSDGATYPFPNSFDGASNPSDWEQRDYIVVATTRPETMLGDTAVAVHPDDERYKALVGKHVILPLVGRRIPIVADEYSDPEKGSGAVKITPAHDVNDFEVGKRNARPIINIFDQQARLLPKFDVATVTGTEKAQVHHLRAVGINDPQGEVGYGDLPEGLAGLDRFAARKAIVEMLDAKGLVEKIEPYVHTVPHGDRSNVVIEPFLTDQWYVDAKTLAKSAIDAVKRGRTVFVPKHWENTYFHWMETIQPWCISRQLWWGHQIPAWYGQNFANDPKDLFVEETEEAAYQAAKLKYVSNGTITEETWSDLMASPMGTQLLRRDEDVLDTWFSSALWPFSTLGWPDQTKELARYYPTDVLVTGFDIIFFWVARMMMMGLHVMEEVPFRDVYIHALVRDEKGQKMSKSKDNVIDPLELIDTYGADALRFTLAAMAAQGRDIKLSPSRVEGYRNFATKLWNAARFAEMNACVPEANFNPASVKETVNRWIAVETAKVARGVTAGIETYKFNEAADAVYHFVWHVFCDWYLELAKPLLNGPEGATKSETRGMTAWAIDQILKLLHPFMPFITEHLWQVTGGRGRREAPLALTKWPELSALEGLITPTEPTVEVVIEFVDEIRSIKANYRVPPKERLSVATDGFSVANTEILTSNTDSISRLANIDFLTSGISQPQFTVRTSVREGEIFIFMPPWFDPDEERGRLQKEIAKINGEIAQIDAKLANEKFIARAPESVVEEQSERKADAEATAARLEQALKRLEAAL